MITNSEGKVLVPVNELSALEAARAEAKSIAAKYVRLGTLKRPATVMVASCMEHEPCETCIREVMFFAGPNSEAIGAALVGRMKRNATLMLPNHDAPRALLRIFADESGLAMFLPELARIIENPQAIVVLTVLHAPDGDFLRGCDELLPDQ